MSSSGTKIGLPLLVAGGATIIVCVACFLFAGLVWITKPPPPPPTLTVNELNTVIAGTAGAAAVRLPNAVPTQLALPTASLSTAAPVLEAQMSPTPTYIVPTYMVLASPTAYVAPVNPTSPPAIHPSGATGQCNDGTYTRTAHKQGACLHHGGVAKWWGP
jgi:hypothetical protein